LGPVKAEGTVVNNAQVFPEIIVNAAIEEVYICWPDTVELFSDQYTRKGTYKQTGSIRRCIEAFLYIAVFNTHEVVDLELSLANSAPVSMLRKQIGWLLSGLKSFHLLLKFCYWFRFFPPFLLKEKVEPKVQGHSTAPHEWPASAR
jgi:hypothetical protein